MIVSEAAKERKRQKQRERYLANPQYQNEWKKVNIELHLLQLAKARAKKYNLPYTLTKEHIVLPKVCPVFGFPLKAYIGAGHGGRPDSYSIDKIDPTKGYIPNNIQIISNKANSMKLNATREELVQFAKWILKEYE